MSHPLDRPVWNALTTRQASLALGDHHALRFAPGYGLFAATGDRSPASLAALAALVAAHGQVALVEVAEPSAIPGVTLTPGAELLQMVAGSFLGPPPAFAYEPLTEADAPQMLALVTLTEPGPFFARTHQLGDFVGVKVDGRLVAMAGERMKPEGFTEVSGVCTHPDHRGQHYAGGLMQVVVSRILARGETPFLHVYGHNTGAVGLYEALGFRLRAKPFMTMLSAA